MGFLPLTKLSLCEVAVIAHMEVLFVLQLYMYIVIPLASCCLTRCCIVGGRDTAGLGGVGGPYRLDAGHDVHQVPQSVKDQVPEHVSVTLCHIIVRVV